MKFWTQAIDEKKQRQGEGMLQCKTDKIKEEFKSDKLEALLRGCVLDLAFFAQNRFAKPLVITSIYRSGIQQTNLCKAYKFKSRYRHCVWSAIDLRTRNLEIDEINELKKYTDDNWSKICHLKLHLKGTGQHMHLELDEEFADMNKLWRLVANTKDAREWFTE